jgi:hypothetical protein
MSPENSIFIKEIKYAEPVRNLLDEPAYSGLTKMFQEIQPH